MDEARRRFLFSARQKMLDHLLSGWRRRGSSLLHIGLNAGLSPENFWEAGFDVTALDRSQDRLGEFFEQTGPKVEYVCANPELLPFEDGEFDYAVLVHHGLKKRVGTGMGVEFSGDGIPPELSEALRVASCGVIILEWNRFSLAGIPDLASGVESAPAGCGVLPWELWSLVGRACPDRRRHIVSVLPLWESTWPGEGEGRGLAGRVRRKLAPLNLTPAALPFGALLGIRVDWNSVPLTPAGVLRTAAEKLCPAKPREELINSKVVQAVQPVPAHRQKRKGS